MSIGLTSCCPISAPAIRSGLGASTSTRLTTEHDFIFTGQTLDRSELVMNPNANGSTPMGNDARNELVVISSVVRIERGRTARWWPKIST